MIWLEAISQLQSGGSLSHDGTVLTPEPDGGYLLRSQDGREEGHTVMLDALDAFASRIGERGLRRAVDRSRYQRLFPTGSSMSWAQEPLRAWVPDQVPLLGSQRRVGVQTQEPPPRAHPEWARLDGGGEGSAGLGGEADELHGEPARAAGG